MVVTVQHLTQVAVEQLNVVMDTAMVMKLKHHVQKTVLQVVTALTVNLIGLLTALNAVIVPGMSLVLTVLLLKVPMAGIALDVTAQVMVTQYVVMALVMVMKII